MAWIPKNFDEACKRNAGRRKLHMRKRKARAERILRLLRAMDKVPELCESARGWVKVTAQAMEASRATASRDLTLARRIHSQFARMFGRKLNPQNDQVVWSWDWSNYGFRAPESVRAGFRKPLGSFPFSLRENASEDGYCGISPTSFIRSSPSETLASMDILSLLKLASRAERLSQRLRR